MEAAKVWIEPEIPNKYEIIPIHNSDRAAFRRCRRYWDWSSPSRNNLTVRADIHGVNIPMFFGTGIHYALEQMYNPILKRDPVEAFKTWFDVMWRGGTVTEDWLKMVYDLKPKPAINRTMADDTVEADPKDLYQVRGLEDILPDPDHAEWDELKELGINMLMYYKKYAEVNDDFEILVAEHDFSVPIWDYDNERILRAVDKREESPNWGKALEVHARGRQDGIGIYPSEKLMILENKTAQRWGEDELRKLESDEQTTHYLYTAEVEATYYDLPHKGQPIQEVVYNVLRKAYPKPPTQLNNGWFSTDRQNESTTYGMLMEFIKKNGLDIIPLNPKQQGYVDYLQELGDENFIVRKPVRRNRHQLKNAGHRLYLETLDMLEEPRIYPNISNPFKCLNCAFRPPCMAKEDGSDWEGMIANNYTINKDR